MASLRPTPGPWRPAAAWLRFLVTILTVLTLAGCFGAPDAKTQKVARSEHDLAADMLRKGRLRAALDHALRASDLDPTNSEAAYLVAFVYLQLCAEGVDSDECRLKSAEKYARRALDQNAEFRDARNTLGVILVHQKRYEAAVEVLKPLTEDILYRSPALAWGNLGWAYLEMGRLDAAIGALRRSVAAEPRFCVGHFRLGLAEQRKGRHDRAVEAFSRAVASDPATQTDPDMERCGSLQAAYLGRARSLTLLKRVREARVDAARCRQLSTDTQTGRECAALLARLPGRSDAGDGKGDPSD